MKCGDLGGCENDATCFMLSWGGRRSCRCDEHRPSTQRCYSIDLVELSSSELEKRQPLPPPDQSMASAGWGSLTKPPSQCLLALTKPLSSTRVQLTPKLVFSQGIGPQFRSFVRTAFEWWHLEDMIYPGYTEVLLEGAPFLNWLQVLSRGTHGISCRRARLATLGWNRDPVLRTCAGPSLFLDQGLPANPAFRLPSHYSGIIRSPGGFLGGVRSAKSVIPSLAGKKLSPKLFGVHTEPFAGGNVISARNHLDGLCFVVGDAAALSVWRSTACPSLRKAKERIAQLLTGTDDPPLGVNVVFVPQWAYHIDLQMLYVGRGTIVLHSFTKQLELVDEFYFGSRGASKRKKLGAPIKTLITTYRRIQAETRRVREGAGFTVVEVAGVFPLSVVDGHVSNGEGMGPFFCFLNGLAVFPDRVLVAHDDEEEDQFMQFAFECFSDELKEVGISVIPVGGHLGGEFMSTDVRAFMYKEEGGLRCKTTTLPKSSLRDISFD